MKILKRVHSIFSSTIILNPKMSNFYEAVDFVKKMGATYNNGDEDNPIKHWRLKTGSSKIWNKENLDNEVLNKLISLGFFIGNVVEYNNLNAKFEDKEYLENYGENWVLYENSKKTNDLIVYSELSKSKTLSHDGELLKYGFYVKYLEKIQPNYFKLIY